MAVKAICHSAVFNEEITVLERPLMGQALFHLHVSFLRCSHVYEEESMSFPKLGSLRKSGNTHNLNPRVESWVLCFKNRDGLSLFTWVHPASFDGVCQHHEAMGLDTDFASNNFCPSALLLQECLY